MAEYSISIAPSMAEVDRAEWDALAAPYGSPLLSWGFLALLEESGSIRPETGWTPAHFLVRRHEPQAPAASSDGKAPAEARLAGAKPPEARHDRLIAAAPFYVKTHSWGEFVFDFEFAEIAQRSKARWYPKLVGMVPATPVPAWRVMTAAGEDSAALERVVLQAAVSVARDSGFGGVHLLWPDLDFAEDLRRDGTKEHWVEWAHQSYLWTDEGYGDFDGYLDSFSKNMRRNVKRERTAVREAGITTRVLSPGDLRSMPRILPAMAELYEAHSNKFGPWAAKFLEKEFFLRLPDFMDSGWAISAAFEDGEDREPLGLAFLLEGKDRLYGRYYGAYREVDCLHFELCYYLPIEYALGHGVGSFDPGMGSSHKARRGFRSRLAPSFHLAFDRRIAGLMERSLPAFNAEEALTVRRLDLDLPFKRRNEA